MSVILAENMFSLRIETCGEMKGGVIDSDNDTPFFVCR
jgi:hypothetical protein